MGMLLFFPLISGFLLFFTALLIMYLILKFILYIFQSFGLLRIAKSEGYPFPYMVWIPCISQYVLGRYCLDRAKSILFCVLTMLSIAAACIIFTTSNDILFSLAVGCGILYFIMNMVVMSKFYQKVYKTPELFTILTVITLGLLKPVFIYTARIKQITKVEIG